MQRFDGQWNIAGAGMLEQRTDPVTDLSPGAIQITRTARQAANNQNEAFGSEGRRLIDGPAIVIKSGLTPGRIGGLVLRTQSIFEIDA